MLRSLASAAAIVAAVVAVAPPGRAVAQPGGFGDVPDGAVYSVPVSVLAERGVFDGTECEEGFCPGEPIDRKTMAVWTVRLLDGEDPSAVSETRFDDVDPGSFHARFVERMAEMGVTKGCGDGSGFCPDRKVTRAEMAVFLSRAYELPDGPDPDFSDVPDDAWYAEEVAKLAASNITVGCGDGSRFCPGRHTTRAETATFLYRAENRPETEESEDSADESSEDGGSDGGGGGRTGGNTGDPNTGDPNTGDPNTGDPNTGDPNTGDPNTGDPNTGDPNTGDPNTGDPNTGDPNTGGPVVTTPNEPPRFITGVSYSMLERDMHTRLIALDDDADDDVTYEITGGADKNLFTIDEYGRLKFKRVPDYESPRDSGRDNVYEVVVTAHSGEDARRISVQQSITITVTDYDHEAPAAPVGPTVSTITDTSLAIAWDAPATAGPPIDGYEVQYRVSGEASWSTSSHSGTGRTANITGLQAGTTYEVQVRATSPEGSSDWSRSPIKLAAVSAGGSHTCGITTDGSVRCWGHNRFGQATPPAGTFTAVSAGGGHTCAIATDSTVTCWGHDNVGQATPPAGTFTAVSAGGNHTCAIATDTTVTCWGSTSAPSPQFYSCGKHLQTGLAVCLPNDVAPVMTFSSITSGWGYTCGINTDGHLVCWDLGENEGYDISLVLRHYIDDGHGNPIQSATFIAAAAGWNYSCVAKADGTLVCWEQSGDPPPGPPAGAFTAVSTAFSYGCGIRTDSTVACWGDDLHGRATAPAGTFSAVSAGVSHACGIRTDGTAVCWGYVGDGRATPPAGTFSDITVGESHSCGVFDGGAVLCWGSGDDFGEATPHAGTFTAVTADYNHTCGILTDGDALCWGRYLWHEELASVGAFTAITSGYDHTCALALGVAIACWGTNARGESTPPQGTFSDITADLYHSCAISTVDGAAVCWGHEPPAQPDPPSLNLAAIATGSDHTCGIVTGGTAVCWGADALGQATAPSGSFSTVAAGHEYSCAIGTGGAVVCWGQNYYGQATPPAGSFSAVAVSDEHSCGITTDGRAVCWGYDYSYAAVPPTVITTATTTGGSP